MTRQVSALVCSLALVVMWPLAASAQTPITIVNPGFETGSRGDEPTGWTPDVNSLWIGDNPPPGGADPGSGYFSSQFASANRQYPDLPSSALGGDAYTASMYQDIDLSPYASEISVGDRYLGVSYAYFDVDGLDIGTISYDFYDSGDSFLSTGYSGQTDPSGGWLFVDSLGGPVPSNASRLRITLEGAPVNPGGFTGSARNVAFDDIAASLEPEPPPPPPEIPTGIVHGNLIQFDSAGGWTWYTDERAIVDPNNGHVLVNSVGYDETVEYDFPGEVDVVNFDPTTGRRERTRLSNQTGNPLIQNDDHNVGALLVLPDGRYLAMYSNHGNSTGLGDQWSRWRRSTSPGDSTSWTTEQLFDWRDDETGVPGAFEAKDPEDPNDTPGNVTYHNLFYLSEEDQVYNISRSYGQFSGDGGTQNVPNIMRYDMATNSVEWAGQVLESGAPGYSAYPKYVSNGVDRIYFISTENHPRNYNNSIFAGYIEDGQTFDMEGNLIDSDMFDNSTVEGGSGYVSQVAEYTRVQQSDELGEGYNRLWTTDLAFDSTGAPMALYTSRWNPDGCGPGTTCDGITGNTIDHRLHLARWNSSTQLWETQEIAKMGPRLYGPEEDYTGLGALVPGDENTVYISTTFDPRDATGMTETDRHEIYKGQFNGSSWDWTAITEDSSVDNLRPIIPDNHGSGPLSVIWFRGNYNTAHDIESAVVGIVERDETMGLVNYIDADASNTTFFNGSPLSTTGPSPDQGVDDNQWHERTGFGNSGSVLTSNEIDTENASMLRTTIEDVSEGLYDIFAYFWSDNDEDWRLQAGLEQNNLMDFRMFGSQLAEADQFLTIDTVSANDNDLQLYRAYLGRTEIIGTADIDVFIDDWQTLNGNASRTWYDGVGYALISDVAPLLIGDYNGDGVVDAADYTVWRDAAEVGAMTLLNRDPANTGLVDEDDYASWRVNFGNTPEPGGGSMTSSVPEPSTALLMLMCAAAVSVVARRRLTTS